MQSADRQQSDGCLLYTSDAAGGQWYTTSAVSSAYRCGQKPCRSLSSIRSAMHIMKMIGPSTKARWTLQTSCTDSASHDGHTVSNHEDRNGTIHSDQGSNAAACTPCCSPQCQKQRTDPRGTKRHNAGCAVTLLNSIDFRLSRSR